MASSGKRISFNGKNIGLYKLLVSKQNLMSYLRINNFNYEIEPDFEKMDTDEFKLYIERITSESNIVSVLERNQINVNPRTVLSNIYSRKDNEEDKLFVFMVGGDKDGDDDGSGIGIKFINTFTYTCIKENCKKGLLFCSGNLTTAATDQLAYANSKSTSGYTFWAMKQDFIIDHTKYIFSPKVIKIYRGKEAQAFIKNYGEKQKSIARMTQNDSFSVFYMLQPGDVVIYCIPIYGEAFYEYIPQCRVVIPGRYKSK